MPDKLELEYVRQKVNELSNDNLVDDYEYVNSETHLEVICNHCGNIYNVSWNNFNGKGTRCKCQESEKRRNAKMIPFSKFLELLNKNGYTTKFNGKGYNGYRYKVKTRCPNGHKYVTYYDNFFQGRRCVTCQKNKMSKIFRLPLEDAREIAKKARLELIDEDYKNMKSKVTFRCLDKSHKFKTTLDSIKFKKTGCLICKSSAGEREVLNNLEAFKADELIVEFEKEYKFPEGECDLIRPLPFDFHVKINDRVSGLIEFDGIQHFDSTICFSKDSNNFAHTQKTDTIKTKYCINNNIHLLRIDYRYYNDVKYILLDWILALEEIYKDNVAEKNNIQYINYSDKKIYKSLIPLL